MNPSFPGKWLGQYGLNSCRAVWRASQSRRTTRAAIALGCVLLAAGCGFLPPTHLQGNTVLLPTAGSRVSGTVNLIDRPDGVQVNYDFKNLDPYHRYALHLHEQDNCAARDVGRAADIFNPDGDRLKSDARPAGDLGEVSADHNGDAHGFIAAPQLTFVGSASVIGRVLILHAQPDEDSAAPDLGAGGVLACGIVRRS